MMMMVMERRRWLRYVLPSRFSAVFFLLWRKEEKGKCADFLGVLDG